MNSGTTHSTGRRTLGRAAAALGLTLALVSGALATAGTAQASPNDTGSFSFSGDEGDFISQGRSYAYSTANKDTVQAAGSETGSSLYLRVEAADSSTWTLRFQADEALKPGKYTAGAKGNPHMELYGNGRACFDGATGTFEIKELVLGPREYVEKLDVAFEYHCGGGEAASRGEFHVTNPPPPAELAVGIDVAPKGQANALNGKATVHGAVSCNVPSETHIYVDLTQVKNKVIIRGAAGDTVACVPGAPVPWTLTVVPTGTTPFQQGKIEAVASVMADDPFYGGTTTAGKTGVLQLVKS
ncbi:hypothetical protein ACH4SP_33300 [Streptomyces sp. NPDC021093]|uniref:hypothetical protein n=1 Tax=Streptomyces sp. NPDC021093 TaxID=3365112 RepID=UPI0037A04D89